MNLIIYRGFKLENAMVMFLGDSYIVETDFKIKEDKIECKFIEMLYGKSNKITGKIYSFPEDCYFNEEEAVEYIFTEFIKTISFAKGWS